MSQNTEMCSAVHSNTASHHHLRGTGRTRSKNFGSKTIRKPNYTIGPREVLVRMPVTSLLMIQYVPMVVVPTIIENTYPRGLILSVVAVAILSSFVIEILLFPIGRNLRGPVGKVSSNFSNRVVFSVVGLGLASQIFSSALGRGTYATQVGLHQTNPIAGLLTPFSYWAIVGVALLAWNLSCGEIDKQLAVRVFVGVASVEILIGVVGGITGQSFAAVLTIMLAAFLAGAVSPRRAIAMALIAILAWPTISAARDWVRRSTVADVRVQVGLEDSRDRLKLNDQFALIASLDEYDMESINPSTETLIRTALIPSVIDGERPPLDTGRRMSIALGGAPTNSTSATMLGNVYLTGSYSLVIATVASLAVILRWLATNMTQFRFVAYILVVSQCLTFNAMFPNMFSSLGQSLQSALAAICFCLLVSVLGAKFWSSDKGPTA